MTLATGTRLGHYEILSPLGAGGMGEVYRAKDPRLGREVAIKVLPEALALDRDRISRFEQEARAASALNHPNIVTIHEIGRAGDVAFIAMELVEGKTLRELTMSGPLPVRRMLSVAAQVADGLAKAHSAGIVHRDLKPENVMMSKDGFVKILDFGLAKLGESGSGEVSAMQTLAHHGDASRNGGGDGRLHVAGAGLGGASGFSVGPVFAGLDRLRDGDGQESVSEEDGRGDDVGDHPRGTGAAGEAPAGSAVAGAVDPGAVPFQGSRGSVRLDEGSRAGSDQRARSRRDLERRRGVPGAGKASPARTAARCRRRRARGGTRGRLGNRSRSREGNRSRSLVQAFDLPPASDRNARFAPDGQTIIYSSDARLYMTRLQSPESNLFAFPGDILSISRSGELAILQNLRPVGRGILATVPMAGGAPRQVLEDVPYGGADWSPDGKNLVVTHVGDDKWRLESPIGKVLALGEFGSPRFSADGGMISFWEVTGRSNSVGVIDRLGKSKKILSAGWTEIAGVPCWAANGREIWFTAGKAGERPALWRVDLSGKLRLAIRVPGILELDDISGDGRVLLTHSTALQSVRGLGPGQSVESDLSWLDGPMPADLSPDGSMLLLNEEGEGTGARPTIYLRSTDGSPALRLSEGDGHGALARQAVGARCLSRGRRKAGAPRPASHRPGRAQRSPDRKARAELGRIHSGREARGLQRRRPGSRGPALRSGHRGRQGACHRSRSAPI